MQSLAAIHARSRSRTRRAGAARRRSPTCSRQVRIPCRPLHRRSGAQAIEQQVCCVSARQILQRTARMGERIAVGGERRLVPPALARRSSIDHSGAPCSPPPAKTVGQTPTSDHEGSRKWPMGARVDVLTDRGMSAPDPRSNRCRGAAAARSKIRPNARRRMGAPWRYSCRPCPPEAADLARLRAPCAILIGMSSALTRYSGPVTPSAPDGHMGALIAEKRIE